MVVREKNYAPRGCMSIGCYIAHFWRMGEEGLRGGRTGGRRKETGDQGAHKNVQEAWLYIRALEILLAREGEERRGMRGERRGEQMAASNNPQTGKKHEWRCRYCRVAHVNGFMWARVFSLRLTVNVVALLKVLLIMSNRVVSCADHYHLIAHATATGQRLLRYEWVLLAPHRCWARPLLCVLSGLSWGEPVVEVCYWSAPRGEQQKTLSCPEGTQWWHCAGRRCVFSHEKPLTAGCPPEESPPANRPLTQKTAPPTPFGNTHNGFPWTLDAPLLLSLASTVPMTRTNCVYRPSHKNFSGGPSFGRRSSFYGAYTWRNGLVGPEVNWRWTTLIALTGVNIFPGKQQIPEMGDRAVV